VELFTTTDAEYLAAALQPPPSWTIDPALRPYHPKRYLQFLLSPTTFSETNQGVAALSVIDWKPVMGDSQRNKFLRCFFQDLAYAVGREQSLFSGEPHALTSAHGDRNRVLRNL